MCHFSNINILVIYGGKTENLTKHQRLPVLGDMYILELDNMCWINVTQHGVIKHPRYHHCMAPLGSRMMIFGGIHHHRYSNNDTIFLEFDQRTVDKLNRVKHDKDKDKHSSGNALPDILLAEKQAEMERK